MQHTLQSMRDLTRFHLDDELQRSFPDARLDHALRSAFQYVVNEIWLTQEAAPDAGGIGVWDIAVETGTREYKTPFVRLFDIMEVRDGKERPIGKQPWTRRAVNWGPAMRLSGVYTFLNEEGVYMVGLMEQPSGYTALRVWGRTPLLASTPLPNVFRRVPADVQELIAIRAAIVCKSAEQRDASTLYVLFADTMRQMRSLQGVGGFHRSQRVG